MLRPSLLLAFAAAVGTTAASVPAHAASGASDCTSIDDAVQRLACYDEAHGRPARNPARDQPQPAPAGTASTPPTASNRSATASPRSSDVTATANASQWQSALWDLQPADKRGTLQLRPHYANYLLAARYTDRPNRRPSSPAPDHAVTTDLPVEHNGAKFQLSFKLKAWENVFGDNGDLWVAYTQQANWQVYNSGFSSPFRDISHQPEAVLSLRTGAQWLGWKWDLLNLGVAHQSNGRSMPLSRSWNRVYAQFGFSRGALALDVKPWLRLGERAKKDDNPDIRDYMGSGEVRASYLGGRNVVSLLGRYAGHGRGLAQLDWAFPISGQLKGYVQLSHGYGETLLDYNHRQSTVGIGVLLLPWQ